LAREFAKLKRGAKKVLLVDADSKLPNLALLKLSRWYKEHGAEVELLKLNLPYYPGKKKKRVYLDELADRFDIVHCSVVFTTSLGYIFGERVDFGGTAISLEKDLPEEVEKLPPDYSLYGKVEEAIGFLTRGCIRKCKFCVVPRKEGFIRQVATVEEVVGNFSKVKFLDNNILALPTHEKILAELVERGRSGLQVEFIQGLDIRLLTPSNSKLLSQLKYGPAYTFAFDDVKYKPFVEKGLSLLTWRKPWQIRFFVYVHPSMPIEHTKFRVEFLRKHKCLTYLMRDISCFSHPLRDFYTQLARYTNSVSFYTNHSFEEFVQFQRSHNLLPHSVANLCISTWNLKHISHTPTQPTLF